ncbi:MAG: carboxypeptidase regulatory-like domain-containing protein [Candidatus Acidiferrales bacterium]
MSGKFQAWLSKMTLVALLFAGMALSARAQSTTDGAIGGVVTDKSGGVVPNAGVTITNQGTASTATGKTDGGGRYLVAHLQPGSYSLEISASGMATYKETNIIVEVGRTTNIDTTLVVASQTTTVVATAEAPVIQTDRPDFSTNFNQTSLDNLPINGRRWSFFALDSPGTVPDGGFGLVSFRGISGLLNNNTVDGADNNQAFFSEERGRTRISYSTSEASIQEFQINTSNYSAEYGRSAGGVVNAVTKSGTNDIHGGAFWYYRDSDLGAINPFVFIRQNVGGKTVSVPFNAPDKRHQFGGDVGGPMFKDRLFFFFSADQQLRSFPGVANSGTPGAIFAPLSSSELSTLNGRGVTTAQANAVLPFLASLTGEVPRTGDQLILLPKIDWVVNSKNHVSFTYNRLRWASPDGIQTGATVTRGVEAFGNDFVKDDWGIIRLTTAITPSLTNEFHYQIGRDFEFEFAQPPIAGEPVSPQQGTAPSVQIFGSGGFTFGKPNFLDRPAFPNEERNQFADTLAWSRGTHLIKVGFDINHVHDTENNLFNGAGAYQYVSRADYISDFVAQANAESPRCGTVAAPLPCYFGFAQEIGPSTFSFATNDLAFFLNDDWRIKPHFTLNLGLRWETELMPNPELPNSNVPGTAFFPSDRQDFGPRIGFAWDLTGKGKMILRGGYGIYYGRIINSTIFNAIADTGAPGTQLTFNFSANSPGAPTYPNLVAAGTANKLSVVQFAPNTRLPMVHQFDIELEQQVATNTVVSVSFLGSLGRNLPRFVDTNLQPPSSTINYTVFGGSLDGEIFQEPLFTNRATSAFNAIQDISDTVTSVYQGLVIAINRRFYRSFQIQSSYTFARANDTGQSSQTFTPFAGSNVLNPFNLGLENGRSIFDIRQRYTFTGVWSPNPYRGDGIVGKELLNGFTIAPIVNASSGLPFSGFVSGNAPGGIAGAGGILGAGGTSRPPFLPINGFQMPRTVNVDLRLEKGFNLWEGARLTLTGDAFNLFNHDNATAVDNLIYSIAVCKANVKCGVNGTTPTSQINFLSFNNHFGVPTASSNSLIAQRQIQIGARLNW